MFLFGGLSTGKAPLWVKILRNPEFDLGQYTCCKYTCLA